MINDLDPGTELMQGWSSIDSEIMFGIHIPFQSIQYLKTKNSCPCLIIDNSIYSFIQERYYD